MPCNGGGVGDVSERHGSSENNVRYIDISLKWAEASHYVASEDHLTVLQRSLDSARELADGERQLRVNLWIGRMHYSLGRTAQALERFQRCLEMAQVLENEQLLAWSYT